ncbi:MAG: hypothetical protein WC054_01410 [Candidatus Nanopelagicales bacterium]
MVEKFDRERVIAAVLREVAGFRRSIQVDALSALMQTLPLVVDEAFAVSRPGFWDREPPTEMATFDSGERVEVYDLLQDAWRAGETVSSSMAEHVMVKVRGIRDPALLPLSVVRRVSGESVLWPWKAES